MNINQYQKDLMMCDYVRVDGLIARVHEDEGLEFYIPYPSDYPGKDYIAGKDFIFVFESISNQTWYKKVDLTQGEYRSSLFYHGYKIRADGLCDPDKYNTAFSLSFTIDQESLETRKLHPGSEVEVSESMLSCELALVQFCGNISGKVDQFIKYLFSKDDTDLKPLPNRDFSDAFGFGFDDKKPLLFNHRHYYMYLVLRSWRENKFPYHLTFADFTYIILLPKPPMRCK